MEKENNIQIEGLTLPMTFGKHSLFYKESKKKENMKRYNNTSFDAYIIYMHLIYTGIKQGTNSVWANNSYLSKGLGFSEERVKEGKRLLERINLIKYKGSETDRTEEGKFKKKYITVLTLTPLSHTPDEPGMVRSGINTLSNKVSSLGSKKVVSKDTNNTFSKKKVLENKTDNLKDKKSPNRNIELNLGFQKVLTIWNKAERPATKHKTGKITKTIEVAQKYFFYLKKGIFLKHCNGITNEWMEKNNIPLEVRNKKFTDKEIRACIKDCIKQFSPGYYPFTEEEKKRILPKTLETTFFNPYNFSCPSVFLKVFFNPPSFSEENLAQVEIKYPETTKKYLTAFFSCQELTQKMKNNIIRTVNDIVDDYDKKIVDMRIEHRGEKFFRYEIEDSSFRTHLLNFEGFIREHIEFVGSVLLKNSSLLPEVVMRLNNGFWDSFLSYYETKYDVRYYTTEERLKFLLE